MAIPFLLPAEETSVQLERSLQRLFVDLREVLRILSGMQQPQQVPAPSAMMPQTPPRAQNAFQPPTPTSASSVGGASSSRLPLPDVVSSCLHKTVALPRVGAPADRQTCWQQLGQELRGLADQFCNKTEVQAVQEEEENEPQEEMGLAEKLLYLILPKKLCCSAIIILVGVRFLKQRFS